MKIPSLWRIYLSGFTTIRWLSSYTFNSLGSQKRPIHIIFSTVDHFEPGTGGVKVNVERARMRTLLAKFPKLVEKHKDFSGNPPKRTWFFPPHYHRNNNLKDLVTLCEDGYGEIELHLHHGKTRPDTSQNLEKTIRKCIEEYSAFGIFGAENGWKRYGFIHGDCALDNSLNGKSCGVNDEIQILKNTGCYADFTFPSNNKANPIKVNSIYYAQDIPNKPKSHNMGITVRRLGKKREDLMIIQGPLYPGFVESKMFAFSLLGDSIDGKFSVTSKRIDLWVRTRIHVKGKRDWVFVKTHTHGAVSSNIALGDVMHDIYNYLETKYNDGYNYVLHYVTARELYNIIKAAEAGESGINPEQYRNYRIQPPEYNSSPKISEASEKLKELIAQTYRG